MNFGAPFSDPTPPPYLYLLLSASAAYWHAAIAELLSHILRWLQAHWIHDVGGAGPSSDHVAMALHGWGPTLVLHGRDGPKVALVHDLKIRPPKGEARGFGGDVLEPLPKSQVDLGSNKSKFLWQDGG